MAGFGGIDLGAAHIKAAIIDDKGELVAHAVIKTGADFTGKARACFEACLEHAGVNGSEIDKVFATGLGRSNVDFADETRTEITCHSAGCYAHFQRAITIVDIGGQDNKVIHLDARGANQSFKMNRKCAAGTGAFLEEVAYRLDVPLSEFDGLARRSSTTKRLSSFCTVFAQTEILARLRQGVKVEDIVRSSYLSVIQRLIEMDPLEGEVVATGGVVQHHPIFVELLSGALGKAVEVPPLPQITGAFGAAILAMKGEQEKERRSHGQTESTLIG